MRNALLCANLNRLSNQSVSRAFVFVTCLGQNLHDASDLANIDHLQKPNQLRPVRCRDKLAPFQECCVLALYCLKVFSIMPEASALTDRSFVVNVHYPMNQIVSE